MRRRRSRSSGGAKRKTHWISFHFSSLGFIPFTTQPEVPDVSPIASEVAYTWCKWPAGLVNTAPESGSTQLEPIDETLVHTTCAWNITARTFDPSSNWQFSLGILPWDSVFPNDFLDVFGSGLDNPDPYFGQLDWVWRETHCLTVTDQPVQVSFGTQLDTVYHSRAMRKLPETTGLLLALSARNVNVANSDESVDLSFMVDGRLLVKSGSAY